MNLYEELGVEKDATQEDIKQAYRRAAAKHHPDREGGDHEKFVLVKKAYETLSDEDKRAYYDQTGNSDQEQMPSAYEIIVQTFASFGESEDVCHQDVLGRIQKHFKEQRKDAVKNGYKLRKDARKWRQLSRRLKVKKGFNPVKIMADKKRADTIREYLVLRGARKLIDEAIKIMDEWSYEWDPKPKAQSHEPIDTDMLLAMLESIGSIKNIKPKGYRY